MRIAVTTVRVPFIHGGAESLAQGLMTALRDAGHEADLVSMPFRFAPISEVRRALELWNEASLADSSGQMPDRVIGLKFPAYCIGQAYSSYKVVWLLHQHRLAYELWGTHWDAGLSEDPDGVALRDEIYAADQKALSDCLARFTISHRVSERLLKHNGLASTPLYHPPALADLLYTEESSPFVFYPSRLEGLKRQELLIDAMAYVDPPVVAILAGNGSLRDSLEQRVRGLGLEGRVKLVGWISDEEILTYYANCLATVFVPHDEDYGLVGLEAMLARKPLITCTDSGEPAYFVEDGVTGYITEPDPRELAESINALATDPARARRMGIQGRERYESFDIRWENIVDSLLKT